VKVFDTRVLDDVAELLELQSGVISRRQVHDAGLGDHDIRRYLRRREWAPVHDGVYVEHTGPLTWVQRAWAAVLFAWPACLCLDSALRAAGGPGRRDHDDDGPIHVAVESSRRVRAPSGVVVHRLRGLEQKSLWNTCPPRLRIEEAALDVAARTTSDFDAISTLADFVQSRQTTAARLLRALADEHGSHAASSSRRCSSMSVKVPAPLSSTPTSPGWRELTVSPPRIDSCALPPATRCTATSSIAIRDWSSSWTGACSTTTPEPGTVTSTGISTPPSTACQE
jgi:hypothetical protein